MPLIGRARHGYIDNPKGKKIALTALVDTDELQKKGLDAVTFCLEHGNKIKTRIESTEEELSEVWNKVYKSDRTFFWIGT